MLLALAPPKPIPHRARVRRAALAALLAMATVPALVPATSSASPREEAAPSTAAGPPAPTMALYAPAPGRTDVPSTHPDLALVRVDGAAYRRANASYQRSAGALSAIHQRHATAARTRSALDAKAAQLDATVAATAGRRRAAKARLTQVVTSIQELAIDAYLSGGETTELALALDVRPALEPEKRRVLAGASLETLVAERRRVARELAAADVALHDAAAQQASVRQMRADAIAVVEGSIPQETTIAPEVTVRRATLEDARVLATVATTDFTLVAMDVYYRSAEQANAVDPACKVEWWGLAGISRVEGRHGTYGGSSLDRNGTTTKPIIGIPLDGSNSTRVVRDSDHGALDGDPAFDRAIGPMQFIPSTWRAYARDGNDDAKKDPQNIYDATLAAGSYLCRASNDLADDPGLRAVYFSYNHSQAYVDNVLGWARGYQRVRIPKI